MFLYNSRSKIVAGLAILATSTTLVITACSGAGNGATDGASTAASLTVSGGFSGLSLASLTNQKAGNVNASAITDYTMICSMLVEPFTAGSKALNADGTFELTIAGASGKPIGCMMTKAAKIVAVVEFTAAAAGMTGASGGSGLAVNEGATSIQFPTDLVISGSSISVPAAAVTQNSSTAPSVTWADPTGTWNITGFCQTELDSTGKLETSCVGAQGNDDVPSSVYLTQLEATNGSETKKGLSIWRNSDARLACGNKEGITLGSNWNATGDWAAPYGGTSAIVLNDTTAVNAVAAKAKVRMHGGTAVCGKTKTTNVADIVDGVTTCAEVDWSSTGGTQGNGSNQDGGWGMNAAGCKLYCIMGALNEGGDNNSYYDWGSDTCKKRYRARWENNIELATNKKYDGDTQNPTPGVFSNGLCSDNTFDGCKDSGGKVLFQVEKALDQFMIGELFISGNVGTLMQKYEFDSTFQNAAGNGTISCKGAHVEKMTMTQTSSTSATVTVESNFVADPANPADCATNQYFSQNENDKKSMVLKLRK